MRVLLFSRSRVVREMVRLAADKAGAKLECVENPSEVAEDRYDLLLIDEYPPLDLESLKEHLLIGATVLIHSPDRPAEEGYDYTVAKPFLPSDILRIVERRESVPEKTEPEITLEGFVADEEEEEGVPRILDGGEIAKIRSLLSDDHEEEISLIEELSGEEAEESGLQLDAEELIDRIFSMKPKKLKKLLQGAEVTITLRFPKERKS